MADAPASSPDFPVWPGTYTLEAESTHHTFKVYVQPENAEFAPGALMLSYLTGRDNENDFTPMGIIQKNGKLTVWKKYRDGNAAELVATAYRLVANPHADDVIAAKACGSCGGKLTVPLSVSRGYGPDCWEKRNR